MIQGSVDNVSTERAVGWIHSSLSRDPLKVEAVINHEVVGEALADLFRPDLAKAGMGSGRCGFEIVFPNAVDAAYLPFVEIRPAGATLALPRTTIAGFSDYLSSIYRKYPSAGRGASILGGLWTDRTDAMSLLKARNEIGTVSARDAAFLARFISDGIVVVNAVVPPPRGSESSNTVDGHSAEKRSEDPVGGIGSRDVYDQISRLFLQDEISRLVRSILDDYPIFIRASACYDKMGAKFAQASSWEELPSPTECLELVATNSGTASVEVVRGSHRFPEFAADGTSRWTTEGRQKVCEAGLSPTEYTDAFAVARGQVALIGPGLIHRVNAEVTSMAIRALVLPARQGVSRFRQQAPAGEVNHRSGARLWLSALT